MKLIVPFKSIDQIPFLKQMGITEVYGGFLDEDSGSENGFTNGRTTPWANLEWFSGLKEAVEACKENGINFNLAFNTHISTEQQSQLEELVAKIQATGLENIIVTDYNFFPYFPTQNIVISTLASIYNSEHIEFLRSQHNGIIRIIMPRELSVHEHRAIIEKFPDLQFEILILNDWCYRNNGTCSSLHFEELPEWEKMVCEREKEMLHEQDDEVSQQIRKLESTEQHCRVCSMHFFTEFQERMHFKIVGREHSLWSLKKDMLFSTIALKNAQSTTIRETIKKNIKAWQKVYGKPCNYNNCEYFRKYI